MLSLQLYSTVPGVNVRGGVVLFCFFPLFLTNSLLYKINQAHGITSPFKEKYLQSQKEKNRAVVESRGMYSILAIRYDFSMDGEGSLEHYRQGSAGAGNSAGVNFTASHVTFVLVKSKMYLCLMSCHWNFRGWCCIFLSNLKKSRGYIPQGVIYSIKNKISRFHIFGSRVLVGYLWKHFTLKQKSLEMRNRFARLMKIKLRFHTVLPVTFTISTLKIQSSQLRRKIFFAIIYSKKYCLCFILKNFRQMNPMYVLYNDF